MAPVHGLGQRIGNSGAYPDHRGFFDAEPHSDCVGGLEPDAPYVTRQPVRIFGHHLHRIRTVGLENADCPRGPDPMAVQEDHDLANDLLLSPGSGDTAGSYW